MRILKHLINWTIWPLVVLYVVALGVVRIPSVQQRLGATVSQVVGSRLGTTVEVRRVDLGMFNRLILDDVVVYDQQQRAMARVARMTAKLELAPLAMGRIAVSSAQIFGARLHFCRPTADAPANYQFLLDSLASDDTTSKSSLNLRINSFIVRRTSVSYDQADAAPTPGRLNVRHLALNDMSAHIILKVLTPDSIQVNVKRFTCNEQSGFQLNRLSFKLSANHHEARVEGFQLQTSDSNFRVDSLYATYDDDRLGETLQLSGTLAHSYVTPADFRCILPYLKNYQRRISLSADVAYRNRTLVVPSLKVDAESGDLSLAVNGHYRHPSGHQDSWLLNIDRLYVADETFDFISKNVVSLPEAVRRLGYLQMKGTCNSNAEGVRHAVALVATDAGSADIEAQMTPNGQFAGNVMTAGIDLGQLTACPLLGKVAANVGFNGTEDGRVAVSGHIEQFEYGGNAYHNIDLDASYATNQLTGWLLIDDPHVSARADVDMTATSLNDAVGSFTLSNLNLPEKGYRLSHLRVETGFTPPGLHYATLDSDFGKGSLTGEFDYTTLAQSVANAVGSKLPTLPGLPPLTPSTDNNFDLKLTLAKTDWLQRILGVDLGIAAPVGLSATVNGHTHQLQVDLSAPAFSYKGNHYTDGYVHVSSPRDTLFIDAAVSSQASHRPPFDITVRAGAADNNMTLDFGWDNNDSKRPLSGLLHANTHLYRNFDNQPEAHVNLQPSDISIEGSVWHVAPADLLYSTDRLYVDHFSVRSGSQHVKVDGTASRLKTDSLFVSLANINVAQILELVNFKAVSFAGKASGEAKLSSVFTSPEASADLAVTDFLFQEGRMGTLLAHVGWNRQREQIDISATAQDGPAAVTYIDGYISPERNYIDLKISARDTYLDFMHSFTRSFISHITGHGRGDLRLSGPLSAINLTGGLRIDGEATITPLNTTYRLKNDTVTFVHNEILLDSLPIYDKYDNVGYLSGAVHHRDLTNLSLDLHVDTDNLLAYDFHDFGDQLFYGTVFAAGTVDLAMKGSDVHIDCNVTPLKNTVFVYNAANPDAISNQEFITWRPTPARDANQPGPAPSHDDNTPGQDKGAAGGGSNIYMNFQINATPDATMRLLMDAKTGDYITLNGVGALQASYYNKGVFHLFGTYTVSSGTYDVTIQNIINKKFQFQPDGTIVFGGDPYAAALNLQALYTVNGVSLSDLQLGNSFSSNTVRVNCLMNIGGQPSAPRVTFDLDLPNVNADEKQMVRSLLSSQQELNQQVLYLLGIGRFYSQGQNNANGQQQPDQTSLAMQSFLSGTLSTQINSVINQIVKNDDWNFGANISTGTEGWNNAEYEGIIAGRMLNNRLLINGQFGYRDKATQANPSFIGDFDIRYLLQPNGNLALKVYNQTNDRYFTRSSLNTQGIGLVVKKDFNGLRDFFGWKRKDVK